MSKSIQNTISFYVCVFMFRVECTTNSLSIKHRFIHEFKLNGFHVRERLKKEVCFLMREHINHLVLDKMRSSRDIESSKKK